MAESIIGCAALCGVFFTEILILTKFDIKWQIFIDKMGENSYNSQGSSSGAAFAGW